MKNWYTERCIKLCSRANGLGWTWILVIVGAVGLYLYFTGHSNATQGCPTCKP